jgi:hypothetical protein
VVALPHAAEPWCELTLLRYSPRTADRLTSLLNCFMHSQVEVVSLKDLELIPQLLAGFAQSLKKGEEFKVKI